MRTIGIVTVVSSVGRGRAAPSASMRSAPGSLPPAPRPQRTRLRPLLTRPRGRRSQPGQTAQAAGGGLVKDATPASFPPPGCCQEVSRPQKWLSSVLITSSSFAAGAEPSHLASLDLISALGSEVIKAAAAAESCATRPAAPADGAVLNQAIMHGLGAALCSSEGEFSRSHGSN